MESKNVFFVAQIPSNHPKDVLTTRISSGQQDFSKWSDSLEESSLKQGLPLKKMWLLSVAGRGCESFFLSQ